jgi:hypothetical protein
MLDPNVLGVAALLATDDASLVEADDVSLVLPKFWPLWLLGNQGLCYFYPKTCFATYSLLKTPIKDPRNHDKPNHGLKKPKKPNSTRNKK